MKQGLQLKQTLKLTMTLQMQQSLKLLQMAAIDLAQYIERQLEENPLLIKEEDTTSDSDTNSDSSTNLYETMDKAILNQAKSCRENSDPFLENVQEPKKTLRNKLLDQIHTKFSKPSEQIIALAITDCLDEKGYFTEKTESIAQDLKCTDKDVRKILSRLKEMEPVGVFAKNLEECLRMQLRDRNHLDGSITKIIENLGLVAKHDYKKLAKLCDCTQKEVAAMVTEVKSLTPCPALTFNHEIAQIVEPDIFVKKEESGVYKIELNTSRLPKILINKRYYAKVKSVCDDNTSKKFLSEHYSTANWLVKALEQRTDTILRVATEICLMQKGFFEKGVHHLHPLTLNEVASALNLHESTISRVVNGKYMATEWGLFELKYFFASSIASLNKSVNHASTAIKYKIKILINKEKKDAILTDTNISKLLQDQGIDIARRTVTKYRESMKIPSFSERKKAL